MDTLYLNWWPLDLRCNRASRETGLLTFGGTSLGRLHGSDRRHHRHQAGIRLFNEHERSDGQSNEAPTGEKYNGSHSFARRDGGALDSPNKRMAAFTIGQNFPKCLDRSMYSMPVFSLAPLTAEVTAGS
jgi:hypothetical protein